MPLARHMITIQTSFSRLPNDSIYHLSKGMQVRICRILMVALRKYSCMSAYLCDRTEHQCYVHGKSLV